MATLGLRINDGRDGGLDTSVADVFAKALFGDPEREMKFAQLQSNLATDEYERRQRQAATAYEEARTGEIAAKQAAIEGAVDPYAKVVRDNLGRSGPLSTEAPVPVEPTHVDLSFHAPDTDLVPPAPVKVSRVGPEAAQQPLPPLGQNVLGTLPGVETATTLPDLGKDHAPVPVATVPETADAMPGNWLRRPTETIASPDDIILTPPLRQAAETVAAANGIDAPTDDDLRAIVRAQLHQGGNFGQTIGTNTGLIGTVYGDPANAEAKARNTLLYTGSNPPAGAAGGGGFNENEQKLRKEYTARPEVQRFDVIQTRYKDLLKGAAQANGVGDTVMIYAMIKMLDPTSSVMQGEQVTAQNAPGLVPAQIVQFNNLLNKTGDKFDPAGRQQFVKAAGDVFSTNQEDVRKVNDYYTRLATENGFKPENIIFPLAAATPPGWTPEEWVQLSPAEQQEVLDELAGRRAATP